MTCRRWALAAVLDRRVGLGERDGVGHADGGHRPGLKPVQEAGDQRVVAFKAVAAGPTLSQVVAGCGAQVDDHRGTSTGHGRASPARAHTSAFNGAVGY